MTKAIKLISNKPPKKIKVNGYEVTKPIKQGKITNKKGKVLPLFNIKGRLLPFPVELLTAFSITPIDKERRIGKIIFQLDIKIIHYPYLMTLLGENCLFLYYRDNTDLHNILTEIDVYLYYNDLGFNYIPDSSFPLLWGLKRDLSISIQEGKSPATIKLIRNN